GVDREVDAVDGLRLDVDLHGTFEIFVAVRDLRGALGQGDEDPFLADGRDSGDIGRPGHLYRVLVAVVVHADHREANAFAHEELIAVGRTLLRRDEFEVDDLRERLASGATGSAIAARATVAPGSSITTGATGSAIAARAADGAGPSRATVSVGLVVATAADGQRERQHRGEEPQPSIHPAPPKHLNARIEHFAVGRSSHLKRSERSRIGPGS